MSATYRIETAYEPVSVTDTCPWIARVYRLSDDAKAAYVWGLTEDDVLAQARRWIERYEATPASYAGRTLHVDDQGRDAEAPQSVKVPE